MAKIQVTTTDTNSFLNAARTVFRNSDGISYVLSLDETNDYIEVSKGVVLNSTPTSATQTLGDTLIAFSQSFTGDGGKLIKVRIRLRKNNSPTGDIYVKLYAHSGTFGTSSIPTGGVLVASDAIDVSTLQTSVTDQWFTFSTPYTIVDGTYYCLVAEYSNGDSTNNLTIGTVSTDVCDGNKAIYTTSWAAFATNDLNITILSNSVYSFILADSLTAETTPVAVSGAIDSDDIIHITWLDPGLGKATPLRYCTFDCDTDTFGTPATLVLDIGETPTSTSLYTAIAIDSNDVPHIVYNEYPKIGGATTYTAMYINKVGGSWNTKVNVEYTQNIDCLDLDISVDLDNVPVISYDRDSVAVYSVIGGTNNATTFTSQSIATVNAVGSSIAVDSNGNHWVAYTDGSGYITIRKHNYSDGWATWQIAVTNSNVGKFVSIISVGTDIYVFYEDDANDVVYDKYDGSSWAGETVLETGTFNNVRAKWGFWVDNDSEGEYTELIENIQALTTSRKILGYQTNENTQAFGIHIDSTFSSIVSRIDAIKVSLTKTGSPTDNLTITVRNSETGTIIATTVHTPTEGINTIPILFKRIVQDIYIRFERVGSYNTSNYWSVEGDTESGSNPDSRVYSYVGTEGWFTTNMNPYVVLLGRLFAELDYAFVDEETSPDIWWNTLSLVSGGAITGTISASATVTGVLKASGKLIGTVSASSTVTGAIQNKPTIEPITGTVDGSATVTGILKASGKLIGVVDAEATVIGNIKATGELKGIVNASSVVIGILKASGKLIGVVDGSSTVLGNLTSIGILKGVVNASGAVTGNLDANGKLIGVVGASSTVTGSLIAKGLLVGTINSEATVIGVLIADGALKGTVNASSTVTGDLTDKLDNELKGIVNASSTMIGVLKASGKLQATINASSNVTGALQANGILKATVNAGSAVIGNLIAKGFLLGVVNASSIVTGVLIAKGTLQANVNANAAVIGALIANGKLIGAINGSTNVVGVLKASGTLQATINGSSTVTGVLTDKPANALIGIVNASSVVTGVLIANGKLKGIINTSATVEGVLIADGELIAIVDGVASVTGNLTAKLADALKGTVNASTNVTANLSGSGVLVGQSIGATQIVANLKGNAPIVATINASSNVIANIKANAVLKGTVGGYADVLGVLIAEGELAGTVQGQTIVVGNLTVDYSGGISGTVDSSSVVFGKLIADGKLKGTVSGTSIVTGSLIAGGLIGEILLGVSDFMPILLLNSEMVIELDKRSELSPTLELESELI